MSYTRVDQAEGLSGYKQLVAETFRINDRRLRHVWKGQAFNAARPPVRDALLRLGLRLPEPELDAYVRAVIGGRNFAFTMS